MPSLLRAVPQAALLAAGLALFAAPALAQTGEAAPAEPETLTEYDASTVLATVGEVQITLGDLIAARQELPPQTQGQPDAVLFEGLLDQLVSRELFSQQGEAQNLGDTPQVEAELAAIKRELVGRAYLETTLQKASEGITDEAARARYEEELGRLTPEEEVRARHILVETEEEAQAIKAEADAGADFATLAEEKSTGPSKARGGDLGFFTRERMVPEFSEAAFALEVGEISEPVKSAFGWHVIKLEERRTPEPAPFEAVREQLIEAMAREAAQTELTKVRDEVVVDAEIRPPFAAIREDGLLAAPAAE